MTQRGMMAFLLHLLMMFCVCSIVQGADNNDGSMSQDTFDILHSAVTDDGLNWAIPIVATALNDKKITMKYKNDVTFVAVEELQKLS